MENLSLILNCILGSTSIVGIIGMIIYRKQNKSLKNSEANKAKSEAKQTESEAEQADIETQRQKIELGNKYLKDTLETVELVKQALDRGEGNQEKMLSQLNVVMDLIHKLSSQTDSQEQLLQLIVKYLNGNFQEYLDSLKQQGLLDDNFHVISRKAVEENGTEIEEQ